MGQVIDLILSNFTPYVGLNVSYFSGKQSDTNYPTDSGTGTYGVGGPKTDVNCWGYAPIIGVFANSGLLKGFGFLHQQQLLIVKPTPKGASLLVMMQNLLI